MTSPRRENSSLIDPARREQTGQGLGRDSLHHVATGAERVIQRKGGLLGDPRQNDILNLKFEIIPLPPNVFTLCSSLYFSLCNFKMYKTPLSHAFGSARDASHSDQ